jgi:rubredoxin
MARRVTKENTVASMVASLKAVLESYEKSLADLKGITVQNFQTMFDDLFKDGGEARCEQFTDLAWPYSLQFGELESKGFETAQWECIKEAVEQVIEEVEAETTILVRDDYENGECPDCGQDIPKAAVQGEECSNCGHVFTGNVEGDDETNPSR